MSFQFDFHFNFKLPKWPRRAIRRHSPIPWPRRAIKTLKSKYSCLNAPAKLHLLDVLEVCDNEKGVLRRVWLEKCRETYLKG